MDYMKYNYKKVITSNFNYSFREEYSTVGIISSLCLCLLCAGGKMTMADIDSVSKIFVSFLEFFI